MISGRFFASCSNRPLLSSLIKQFRISAVYARRLFKTHHGEAIGSYITRQKLELAVQLLQEGNRPGRVARYLGWTPAYFSRAYKARFGAPAKSISYKLLRSG